MAARAARGLARIRARVGRGPDALRVLDRELPAGREPPLEVVRSAARDLSVAELAEAASLFGGRPSARGVVLAERARGLALAGRTDSARDAARRVLDLGGGARSEERETARSVLEGELGPEDRGPVRLGLVLPLSGDLESVGRLLREAATVTASAAPVELLVRDDSSRASTVPDLVRGLEEAGVTAVLGPVTTEGFRAAVEARTDPSLPVVSPGAASPPSPAAPNAYTLWARTPRLRELSRTLGSWVPARTGLRRLGLLREASGAGRVYEHGFRAGARRAGGWVTATGTFGPAGTTFREPLRWLASNRPESLLVGTGNSRTVLQMAPQLSYYGLRTPLVAGTSAWGRPVAVRRLSAGFPSRWVTAVFVDRTAEGTPWAEFRRSYEKRYRKSLPPRQLPALAHDAVRWAADALGPGRLPRRGVVARGLASGSFEGASGRFSARPEGSTVEREAVVRMAAAGELHAPDTAALAAWRRKAKRLAAAGRRRRREEARRRVERWMRRHGDSVRVEGARPPRSGARSGASEGGRGTDGGRRAETSEPRPRTTPRREEGDQP